MSCVDVTVIQRITSFQRSSTATGLVMCMWWFLRGLGRGRVVLGRSGVWKWWVGWG